MARELRIEELIVVADPWNLKLKPAKLKGDSFLRRCEDQYCPLGTLGYVSHCRGVSGLGMENGSREGCRKSVLFYRPVMCVTLPLRIYFQLKNNT